MKFIFYAWNIIEELHASNPAIKGTKFIRNYGNQKALMAGLDGVREIGCDCVVSIDADLQQDEYAIEKFIDECIEKKKELITLSLIASSLILISGLIFLYIAINDEELNVELAFN